MNSTMRTILAAAAACGFAGSAAASELYGVNFAGAATLYSVNQSTGVLDAIGLTGRSDIGDLTSNAANGTVWGIDIPNNTLYTFNTSTGAAGPGVALTGVLNSSQAASQIVSLAYDAVSGVLYGNTSAGFGGETDDLLYSINPVTGAATFVGRIGFNSVFALAFDTAGVLYGVAGSQLLTINTGNGNGASAGTISGSNTAGSYFDIAARPEDNAMFIASSSDSSLYRINTGTAGLTAVGPYGSNTNIVGLAFVSEVPEPSTYVLMLAGLLGLGFLARRRAVA